MRMPVVVLAGMSFASGADLITLSAESGQATFVVDTNVGLDVTGKSQSLRAEMDVRTMGDKVQMDRISATVAVKTLATGMELRDEHMRRMVFDLADGYSPDLKFEAAGEACAGLLPGKEAVCPVRGTLAIRGIAKAFTASLKVRREAGNVFRIRGDGTVKLSDYGIEQPSQLGVKTEDKVTVHLDFVAKPAPVRSAAR